MGLTYCKTCKHRMSLAWHRDTGTLVTQCADCTPTLVIERPAELFAKFPDGADNEEEFVYRNLSAANARPVLSTVFVAFLGPIVILLLALAMAQAMNS